MISNIELFLLNLAIESVGAIVNVIYFRVLKKSSKFSTISKKVLFNINFANILFWITFTTLNVMKFASGFTMNIEEIDGNTTSRNSTWLNSTALNDASAVNIFNDSVENISDLVNASDSDKWIRIVFIFHIIGDIASMISIASVILLLVERLFVIWKPKRFVFIFKEGNIRMTLSFTWVVPFILHLSTYGIHHRKQDLIVDNSDAATNIMKTLVIIGDEASRNFTHFS